ncbi:FxSxx-COOH system tetratricopeptide repeat protein [Lentzea sp. BCCO 10_0856]|uniref:FxSxx-COOH system tetratricopeptide repeat protein n=1 Tax=Lentzea miocenica TaxID=3095431 RepID=A0ABU4T1F8_9PSEU|nr:FxSxx-COOH system tetratricopeptide repeat protein [Lentzea sp. BCCO 10_0856]MDX8031991.1 FxSxx-COOH system tetratricopeptide repeat protein [Lentzea sp. BCCO 10_0856]
MAQRVFISYAQESPEHRAVVLNLYAFLRENGIDAHVDQIAAGQRQDWSLWMADQIRDADVVLCVASEQYRLRSQGQVDERTGRGVQWEARLIRAAFYDSQQDLQKFVPVVLPGQATSGVPDFLTPETATVYTVEDFTEQGAEDLLRFLWQEPKYSATPLGRKPNFGTVTPSVTTTGLNSIVSPQVAGMAEVIGRDQELADLRTAFTAQRKTRTPVIQVLTGMGGVGKTSLARAYAQHHLDDYEVVWWVRAEDPGTVDGEYRSLLELVHSAAEAKLVRDAVQVANTWLSQQKKPWLLVLDNLPDSTALRGLHPVKGNGHVLVTSQSGRWPNPGAVHHIDPLGTDAAVELLATVSQDADTESAAKLAAELDGLPLALTQAASFAFSNGGGLATYLRLYQDRSAELHADGQPDDYPHTVATTWLLAIEKISPRARLILNTIAYFAPDSIPISVLHPLMDDELALRQAVGELLSHSLVTHGANDTCTVHRLIQAVTRHQLGDNAEHAARACELITSALPEIPLDMRKMDSWKQVRSHALTASSHLPTDPRTFEMRYKGAFLHGDGGDLHAAVTMLKTLIHDLSPVVGPDDERVLRARYGVAHWSYLFTPAQAHKVLLDLVEAQTTVLGADHPDTLTTQHDLATALLKLGQFERGRRLLEELVPLRTRVLGPDHELTLQARSRLALALAQLDQFDEAMRIHEEVLTIANAEFGGQDQRTMQYLGEYAETLGRTGHPAAARDLHAFVVGQLTTQRGTYDKVTLMSQVPLALWTASAGNPQRAGFMLLRMLVRMRNSLGKNNPLITQFEEALNSVRGSGPAAGRH